MSLTKIGSIGINTGIQLTGVTTVSTLLVGSGVTLSSDGDVFATGISTFSEDIKVGSGVTISPDGDGFYTGVVTATTFSGALAASNLTGALPAISGANLTNLDASDLASGTVPTARLGSGTASSSTFLRGDSTFAVVTSTTINNNANNRLITGSGTADTLEGEANLLFDGTDILEIGTAAGGSGYDSNMKLRIGRASDAQICIRNTGGDTNYGGIVFGDQTAAFGGAIQYYHDTNSFRFKTAGDNERIRINSSGLLLVGTTDDVAGGATNSKIQIRGTSYDASLAITANRTASGGGNISFSKSRAASQGDATIVQSGDTLGSIVWYGADGTDINTSAAQLDVQVDTTPGSNDMPGRFVFRTTSDGAATSTERLRIDSSGRVGINRTPALAYSKLEVGGADNYPLINVEASGATGGMGIGSGVLRLYYGTVSRLNITDSTGVVSAANFTTGGYFGSSGPGGGTGIKLQGLAAGSGSSAVDTGISVNRGNAGATMLVIGSRNTGAGTATQGYAWLLKFQYDGNQLPTEYNIAGTGSFWSLSLSGSNTLQINGNVANWQFGGMWVD